MFWIVYGILGALIAGFWAVVAYWPGKAVECDTLGSSILDMFFMLILIGWGVVGLVWGLVSLGRKIL